MAKLNAAERKRIPKSKFGLPSKRAYPMPDASHARNAKARASEMEKKGRLSASEKHEIDRKADMKLHHHEREGHREHARHREREHERNHEHERKHEHAHQHGHGHGQKSEKRGYGR